MSRCVCFWFRIFLTFFVPKFTHYFLKKGNNTYLDELVCLVCLFFVVPERTRQDRPIEKFTLPTQTV